VEAHYAEVVKMLGPERAPPPEFYLRVYGRMAVNSFHVLNEEQEGVGFALYLGPSIMDHSCRYS